MDPVTLGIISTIVQTLILPFLAILLKQWVAAKVESIKSADTRKAIEFAMDRLDETARTVVRELNQTSKRLSDDGKLSAADARELLRTAMVNLWQRLPSDAEQTLKDVYGEKLPAVIQGKIEATVATEKKY